MIWKSTLQRRVLELGFDLTNTRRSEVCELGVDDIKTSDFAGFHAPVRQPIALEICRSSRNAVIGQYPLCFGSNHCPSKIGCNLELDVIYLRGNVWTVIPHFFSMLTTYERANLRYLAVDSEDFTWESEEENEVMAIYENNNIAASNESLSGLREFRVISMVEDAEFEPHSKDQIGRPEIRVNVTWQIRPMKWNYIELYYEQSDIFVKCPCPFSHEEDALNECTPIPNSLK